MFLILDTADMTFDKCSDLVEASVWHKTIEGTLGAKTEERGKESLGLDEVCFPMEFFECYS